MLNLVPVHDEALRPPGPEPDVWPLAALDLEPEQCWCLSCGDELPCSTCLSESTHRPKEAVSHA
jgi:hypothetical protein